MSIQKFELTDRVAIVTGALGLLGEAHCEALAEAGAIVVACDLYEEGCHEFAATLPGKAVGIGMNVAIRDTIQRVLDTCLKQYGRVDILVNNAAINDKFESPEAAAEQSRFENYPIEQWQHSIDVNVTGIFNTCQIIGSQMAKQKRGSIINIASTYGVVAPNQDLYKTANGKQNFYKTAAYPTTKGAVISFTRFLAAYWGNQGVRVNTLSPGGVQNGQEEFFIENYSSRTPLGRMATMTDYQGAIVFLSSDASSYMTGANLIVDGGWTAW